MDSDSFTSGDLELIRKQEGLNGMRSLFSLYIPENAELISVIKDLQNELDRIKQKMTPEDDHRALIIELLQELISLIKMSDFQNQENGIALFFGLNSNKEKIRWKVYPLPGSAVMDYLLVCDHAFYIDSCLME